MSLVTMGLSHLTTITMGLGISFRIYNTLISRPRQYGVVRFVDDTPEVEEIDDTPEVEKIDDAPEVEEIDDTPIVKMTDSKTGVGYD